MAETCATELLDEALQVGARELDALRAGDVDLASELCERRADLMERGWARRENDCGELRSRLLALRDLQELLFEEGRALKRQIRDQLNQSKEQMRRMRGYGQAVGQAMRWAFPLGRRRGAGRSHDGGQSKPGRDTLQWVDKTRRQSYGPFLPVGR